MTDREGFLERWSRRKQEAAQPDSAPDAQATDESGVGIHTESARAPGFPVSQDSAPQTPEPEFDLSQLPSLDSITATTDMKPFLAPGVPREIARAALRRAWESDPAIRDFVGLQENDWNFNDPDSIAGFGELPADYDLKQMVAKLFGDPPPNAEQTIRPTGPAENPQPEQVLSVDPPEAPATHATQEQALLSAPHAAANAEEESERGEIVQRNENAARHKDLKARRKHGGALPQ